MNTRSEKPILFSAPMVQAILQGRKTQTRRTRLLNFVNEAPADNEFFGMETNPKIEVKLDKFKTYKGDFAVFSNAKEEATFFVKNSFGNVGDLLWVRETHAAEGVNDNHKVAPCYKASGHVAHKWIPSIHMKKDYARIWLQIEEITVERLQDISTKDAISEGITPLAASSAQLASQGQLYFDYTKPKQLFNEGLRPFWSFNSLWCSINGGDSWEANPWVWVVKFKVVSTNGKPE